MRSFALLARGGLQRDSEFNQYVTELDTLFEIARSGAIGAKARDRGAGSEAGTPRRQRENQVIFGTKRLSGQEFLRLLSSACLDTSLSWDPGRVVPLVMCPVLVVYGAKDVQAPACENVAAARALVDRQGKSNWTIRELAEMNHAFQR